MNDIMWEAIIRANKLGRKGFQVISYGEQETATERPEIKFVVQLNEPETAADLGWWEK